ncbi:reverse transcriptase domain-containing protein [Tanacetum coccineum]
MKKNGVSQDSISLNLFPFSLTHEAESWFYHLKTHSIHTWEEMILKFLSKYYPHSRALQLRKDILNFWQLPMKSVFEDWERFKSCLRKCPNHRILLLNQILTFYYGITMIDQERLMVAAGSNFMRKTPQKAYDLIENMTQHHFQWDAEVYYDTTTEKSSGSTTTNSDYSLPDYDAFYFDDDHIEEKSSGSTTTHSDFSLPEYDSFIFDLSIDPFPPTDRSDSHHEEFADELSHIISSPEYDCLYFNIEPDLGELTILFEENISKDSTKELTSPELNDFPLLLSNCDSTFFKEFFEIDILVSFPLRNKDKNFDPGIFIIKRVQSKRFHIFQLDDFPTISFVGDSLLLIDPSEIETFLSFPSGNEDKVFDPEILIIDGIFSFTRKFPHLLINNFLIV